MGFGSITTSGFLAAYALILGASNFQIGLLASIPFITQPLQIPAILLIEKVGNRKFIALVTWLPAQLLWIPMAAIPLFFSLPSNTAIWLLLTLMIVRSFLNAVTSCSWNSWIRDLVPQNTMGSFFARRLMLGSVAAIVFGLAAALFVDWWGRGDSTLDEKAIGYTIALFAGAITLGLLSPFTIALMPEPLMQRPAGVGRSLISALKIPLRDKNYSHLLRFHFLWGVALNLATPFFAVYMLQRLGLPLSAVIGFSILAQVSNVLFLKVWGPMVDRLGAKVILQLSASLYMLVILGWVFTTMPEKYFLTIPLLLILHLLSGVAAAGVNISSGVVAMRLAPQGDATSYLAVNSLAANVGAGIGPLLGGIFATVFATNMLDFNISWTSASTSTNFPAFSLAGFDFLFGIAFVLGLFSLSILAALQEDGEVGREVVLESLIAPMRRMTQPMSTVPGLGIVGHFPYGAMLRAPIPGLDVAFGVTAYQLAETARTAKIAVGRGADAVNRVSERIGEAVRRLKKPISFRQEEIGELAVQTARGLAHAETEMEQCPEESPGEVVEQAVGGLQRAGLGQPEDLVASAAQGAVRGAIESGVEVEAAIINTMVGVANLSRSVGGFTDRVFEETSDAVMEIVMQAAPDQRQAALDELQNSRSQISGEST
ncbi:MAG: MFS transporter [Chloroflexi bacterium]|nr:MFS transporter [Chloroflexota bacterium]